MATLSVKNPTLLDVANASDPNGKIAAIAEIMNQTNEVLDDMTFKEGNLVTGEKVIVRTGIPAPTWRKMNGGVQPVKSTTAALTFNCGQLANYSEIDKDVADLNGNTSAYRLSQDRPIIEGINQEFTTTLFYGNDHTTPESFMGLSSFYNDSTAKNAENLILGDGVGTDNASIWLIVWSPETIYGITPKGMPAGLRHTDKGIVTIENADGANGRMEAYRSYYQMFGGVAVKDWRYAVRIANIDKSNLKKDAASGSDLLDLMFQAIEQIPALNMGRPVFYMSRTIRSFVRRQATNATKSSTLTIENVGGKQLMTFNGIPMKRVDALAADETLVA